MITLKTTTPVIILAHNQYTDYLYMNVKGVYTNLAGYVADVEYYYVTSELIGEITNYHKHPVKTSQVPFSLEEAALIQASIPGGLTGATHYDEFIQLVAAGCMYQTMITPTYGATWIIVPDPVPPTGPTLT